ncbi:hypothetical protein CC79DRAFT_1338348 [Sarocladium strictum]
MRVQTCFKRANHVICEITNRADHVRVLCNAPYIRAVAGYPHSRSAHPAPGTTFHSPASF